MLLLTTPDVFNACIAHPDLIETFKVKVTKVIYCKCGRLNCTGTVRHRAKLIFVMYKN